MMSEVFLKKKKEISDIVRNIGFKQQISHLGNEQWYWFKYENYITHYNNIDFYIMFEDSDKLISLNFANFQNYLDLNKIDTKDILQHMIKLSSYLTQSCYYEDPGYYKELIEIYEREISRFNSIVRDYKLNKILQ